MTLRFTSSNLAGTLRNDVAVGTERLRSMLEAIAAPAPRIGSPSSLFVPPAGPVEPNPRTAGAVLANPGSPPAGSRASVVSAAGAAAVFASPPRGCAGIRGDATAAAGDPVAAPFEAAGGAGGFAE